MRKITVGVFIILYALLQNAYAETPTTDSLARTILNNAKRPSRSPFQKMTHEQDTNSWDGFSTLCGQSIKSQNFGCYFGNDRGMILPLEDLKDFLSDDVFTRLSSMWSTGYLEKHGKKYVCMHGQSSLLNSDKSTAIRNLSQKVTRKKFRDDTGTIIPVPPPPSPPMAGE